MVLVLIGIAVVLMLLALPFAKRHDVRNGHVNRGIGDICAEIRARKAHQLETRLGRRLGVRPPPPGQRRRPGQRSP